MIAREGEGSMRDAQSLLDQVIAYAGKTVRDEDVIAALGLADRKLLYGAADAILDHNPARALELLNELHLYGYDLRRFARELLEHFRNLAVARLLPGVELLPDLPDEERAEVNRQAEKWSSEDLDRGFRLLLAAEAEVGRVPYPKLVLEMSFIKLATLTPVLAAGELLERLDDLERRVSTRAPAPSGTASPAPGGKAPAPVRSEAVTRARHDTSAADPEPAAAVSSPSENGSWEEFLTFVGKEKAMLFPYLKSSQPVNCEGPALALAVPRGFNYDYLAQHTRQVEDIAQRFFGRPLRVTVNAVETGPAPPASTESAAALHAAALGNPVVRAAVDILGGEVREVRPRARRERGNE